MPDLKNAGGVWPAAVTPFAVDSRIDERALHEHVGSLAATDGVNAVVVNGHASEATSLTRGERAKNLVIARDACGSEIGLVAGVIAESASEAIELARDAEANGADAVLLFPPRVLGLGGQKRAEVAKAFVRRFSNETEIPICLFQLSTSSGLGYSTSTLVDVCADPKVIAVKEGSDDPVAYEMNLRALKDARSDILVLSTNNAWLLASLAVGGDGILSGMGSVASDLFSELVTAVSCGDLGAARKVNDRVFPLTQVFYRRPLMDMHNRMKVALQYLGRIPTCTVREPLLPLGADEIRRIHEAVEAAGLSKGNQHA